MISLHQWYLTLSLISGREPTVAEKAQSRAAEIAQSEVDEIPHLKVEIGEVGFRDIEKVVVSIFTILGKMTSSSVA